MMKRMICHWVRHIALLVLLGIECAESQHSRTENRQLERFSENVLDKEGESNKHLNGVQLALQEGVENETERELQEDKKIGLFGALAGAWSSAWSLFDCFDGVSESEAPSATPSIQPTPPPANRPTLTTTAPPTSPRPSPPPTSRPTPNPTTRRPTQAPIPSSNFNIALDLKGVANTNPFTNAVERWRAVITGDLPDITEAMPGTSACGAWPAYVDDLYICGEYKAIDGRSGVLGSAGPRYYRSGGTPITGEMQFDSADVDFMNLVGVILHEMGHVLGIGPLWQTNSLTTTRSVPCPYKYDSKASQVYREMSGCDTSVPVEQSYSNGGSNCGHWKEQCFGSELMTPSASSQLPMSRLTIAGLEDLGYQVTYANAESFSNLDSSCMCKRSGVRGLLDEGDDGQLSVDKDGIVSRHRRLSDEGNEAATQYGKMLLQQKSDTNSFVPLPDGIKDMGAELVFVLYEENDTIFSIMVTAE